MNRLVDLIVGRHAAVVEQALLKLVRKGTSLSDIELQYTTKNCDVKIFDRAGVQLAIVRAPGIEIGVKDA